MFVFVNLFIQEKSVWLKNGIINKIIMAFVRGDTDIKLQKYIQNDVET